MCELKLWIIGDNLQHGSFMYLWFCAVFILKKNLFWRIVLMYMKITSTENTWKTAAHWFLERNYVSRWKGSSHGNLNETTTNGDFLLGHLLGLSIMQNIVITSDGLCVFCVRTAQRAMTRTNRSRERNKDPAIDPWRDIAPGYITITQYQLNLSSFKSSLKSPPTWV